MFELNDTQKAIIDEIVDNPRQNYRISGRAGTGKTTTLQHLMRAMRAKGEKVACVTPTVAAAVRVENDDLRVWATTLHRFFGFKAPYELKDSDGNPLVFQSAREEAEWQIKNGVKNGKTKLEVNKLTSLVIEECSMVGEVTLLTIHKICREITGRDGLFGGIRVVMVGDFKQLPPVRERFCFHGALYKAMEMKGMHLTRIVRTDDLEYAEFQNAIAKQGGVDVSGLDFVKDRWIDDKDLAWGEYLNHTHLFDMNKTALAWNERVRKELFDGAQFYEFPLFDPSKERGDSSIVTLCKGMRVMVTANQPGLVAVNGDIGHIHDFRTVDGEIEPLVRLRRNNEIVAIPWKHLPKKGGGTHDFMPVRAGYAATVHKFQGITTDDVVVRCYHKTHGKLFVALTRCTRGSGLWLHREDMREEPRTAFSEDLPPSEFL